MIDFSQCKTPFGAIGPIGCVLGSFFGSGRSRCRQVAYSHQVDAGPVRVNTQAHPFYSSVTGFPEIADGFHPAENFLHLFPQALTDGVAGMAGSPVVDGRVPALAVLGHIRQGIKSTERLDKLPVII